MAGTALGVLGRPSRRAMPAQAAFYTLLFLTSLPLLHNFKWGQVRVVVTLCVLAALRLSQSRRWVMAAVVLAMGVAIKYYVGVFVLWYVLRRQWRAVAAFGVAVIGFVVVFPALFLGPVAVVRFQRESWLELSRASTFIAQDWNSQYFAHVVLRWLGVVDAPGTVQMVAAIGWTVVVLMGWAVWSLRHSDAADAAELSTAALFVSLPFLISTSWPHYFVYLPFCQSMLFARAWPRTAHRGRVVSLGMTGASMALSSVFAFQSFPAWEPYAKSGILLAANVLLAIPILLLAHRTTAQAGVSVSDSEESP